MESLNTVTVELTEAELNHLENDLISYIWHIKESVFGDYNFGTKITEVKKLTKNQKDKLKLYGYYSRVELLNKLKKIHEKEFPQCECCGE